MSEEHNSIKRTISAFLDPEFESLIEERIYSMTQWDSEDFDDKNTLNDWVTYITIYAGEAAKMKRRDDPAAIYGKLIKVANLALLVAERVRSGTVAPRHYDGDDGTEIRGNLST
jgi:hypothetical protein